MNSNLWTWASDFASIAGVLLAILATVLHYRAARAGRGPESSRNFASRAMTFALAASVGCMATAMWRRYVEVNHFPSQNMSEVLSMFSFALLLSAFVLHFALGLRTRSPGWAIVDDALMMLVFASATGTHYYARTLSNAQRDLPPALQSYWFPPHLSSLIFSYATLGIAGLIALVYFAARFWGGVFAGGRSTWSQLVILAALVLLPFVQVVTIPVLVACGIVFWILQRRGKLPSAATWLGLERELDDVSYRAFSVGIPFLTAGLFMGAFWAQDAWANYWGWDSKENSALITWLIYIAYIHLRMLGGYRGEKAMAVLMGGALSVFITFQLFGYLPDSQKNTLHRYTDDGVTPREGQQSAKAADDSARVDALPTDSDR